MGSKGMARDPNLGEWTVWNRSGLTCNKCCVRTMCFCLQSPSSCWEVASIPLANSQVIQRWWACWSFHLNRLQLPDGWSPVPSTTPRSHQPKLRQRHVPQPKISLMPQLSLPIFAIVWATCQSGSRSTPSWRVQLEAIRERTSLDSHIFQTQHCAVEISATRGFQPKVNSWSLLHCRWVTQCRRLDNYVKHVRNGSQTATAVFVSFDVTRNHVYFFCDGTGKDTTLPAGAHPLQPRVPIAWGGVPGQWQTVVRADLFSFISTLTSGVRSLERLWIHNQTGQSHSFQFRLQPQITTYGKLSKLPFLQPLSVSCTTSNPIRRIWRSMAAMGMQCQWRCGPDHCFWPPITPRDSFAIAGRCPNRAHIFRPNR